MAHKMGILWSRGADKDTQFKAIYIFMAFFGVAFSELSAQEVQGRFMLNLTTLFLKVLKV